MERNIYLRALAGWFVLMIVAILNGIMRTALISPHLGEQSGHVISTITLCIVLFAAIWITNPWIKPAGVKGALAIGVFWLLLTVAFEFIAGHYLFGHSWEKLSADYNLIKGRVWVLVLITILFAPACVEQMRDKSRHALG